MFILRSVFAVFGRLKLAALSPNLSREAVHLGFSGFARVYLGFDPGLPGFTWVSWGLWQILTFQSVSPISEAELL